MKERLDGTMSTVPPSLELANQLVSESKVAGKEKELLEKAIMAIVKTQRLDWFLSKMIAPERMTRMKILEVLSDKEPRGWSQLQRETGLSPSTLSRGLKAMVKEGWIDRAVISRFPPTSTYAIKGKMVEAGRFFRRIRTTIARNFFAGMVKEFSDEETIKSTQHTSHIMVSNALELSLLTYKDRDYQVTEDMVFYSTFSVLMYFWSFFMGLIENKELTDKAVKTFMNEVKRYEKELKMVKNISDDKAK